MQTLDEFKFLKGHFHLDILNSKDEVIDAVDDHNMIMTDARKSMAEIFANLTGIPFAHRLVLGTMGNVDGQIFIPKDENSGFTKERNRLFSEVSSKIHSAGDLIETIHKFDVLQLNGANNSIEYYRYNGDNASDYLLSERNLASDDFTKVTKPYTYTVNFRLPRTNVDNGSNNNTDEDSLDTIKVEQKDTSVIFTFTLDLDSANEQHLDEEDEGFSPYSSLFNEAAIYVNNRIFCMKTFTSKLKDDSVKFRIIWTITF